MRKKMLLIGAAALLMLTACNGRLGSKTDKFVNDGHDYQWIAVSNKVQLIHSPECDTCKIIRKRETIAVIDSIMKDRITFILKQAEE
jgi:hypothetical protein